jgi:hypothetical protein
VPADCSDGDACTTDVCQGGTCVHQRQGFDAVACELGKLTTPTNLCAPDPLDAKLAQALTIKGGTRARNFVGKPRTIKRVYAGGSGRGGGTGAGNSSSEALGGSSGVVGHWVARRWRPFLSEGAGYSSASHMIYGVGSV